MVTKDDVELLKKKVDKTNACFCVFPFRKNMVLLFQIFQKEPQLLLLLMHTNSLHFLLFRKSIAFSKCFGQNQLTLGPQKPSGLDLVHNGEFLSCRSKVAIWTLGFSA